MFEDIENDIIKMQEERKKLRASVVKIFGSFGIVLIALVALIFFFSCTYKINPGYSGVIYNMNGGIEDDTLGQGFHVVSPWKKVIEYPVSTETVYYTKSDDDGEKSVDNSINVNTKDGKQVNVSVTYAYHMDVAMLPSVFEKFRGQDASAIESGYMKNEMYQAINEVTSQYSLMELVGNKRPQINEEILKQFRNSLAQYGIVIETFNLSDVVPDEQTKKAIQAVVDAQNALEQAKIEKEKAEVDAEKARVSAKGKADAEIIQAEGTATANAKLQESLTPLIVEQRKIEKWNGTLPNIVAGDSNLLIQP